MPLDGATLQCIRAELLSALDCHIDKIHIPSKNEFVFGLRSKGVSKKLYISLAPDAPRVSFTEVSFDNPQSPPMFCMLLRKHLSSGRLIAIENAGTERLLIFKIQSTNEMGDKVLYSLVLELLGHKTNLILVGGDGKILGSARLSDIENGDRLIQPGAAYRLPENSGKADLLNGDIPAAVATAFKSKDKKISDALLENIGGISPLICREIAFLLAGDTEAPLSSTDEKALTTQLTKLKKAVISGGSPLVLTDQSDMPKDFSFTEIKQYGTLYKEIKYNSFSSLLEAFYGERERIRRLDGARNDLLRLIKNLISRNAKKLQLRRAELKKTESKDTLRIYGELIKANLYCIEKGASMAKVQNYYDPQCKEITIPLNSAISPQNNAAKYFKEYKKACTAEQTLGGLIEECQREGEYLESVLFSLQNADNKAELAEIRAELEDGGYIIVRRGLKRQKSTAKPMEFFKNGFRILVGKNNLQNDILTLKTAAKSDLWFHTKNIHGSHVILFTDGKEPDDDTLLYAANLAAKYSKAADSNQVPVDYTPVKFVKKPAGAKAGMVIYSTNKTIFANPNQID